MNILKKFNLLDYIIFGALLLSVGLGVYNFIPRGRSESYRIFVSLSQPAEIKNGDLCYDFSAENDLGGIFLLSDSEFYVIAEAKKTEHGIRINGKNYLENMPVSLYIGDYYAEGKIREICRDG